MEKIIEISIILMGSWNKKIFTPPFIMNELLNLRSDEELEVGFDNNLQPIFKYLDIHLIPTERAFEIRFGNINETAIEIANKVALKLISTLPFTPNLLVGFNYKMNSEYNLNNINIPYFLEKYELNEIKLSKNENSFILNVILNCKDKKTVTYNFHYSNLNFIKDNAIIDHLNYLNENGN